MSCEPADGWLLSSNFDQHQRGSTVALNGEFAATATTPQNSAGNGGKNAEMRKNAVAWPSWQLGPYSRSANG